MRLIIGTDHCFDEYNGKVKDKYVFGTDFFSDYLKVYSEVLVVARVRKVKSFEDRLIDTEAERITFFKIPYVGGAKWMLYNFSNLKGWLDSNIKASDRILVRLPSEIGNVLASYARRKSIRYMAEVIGDPLLAVLGIKPNHIWYRLAANYAARQMRNSVSHAHVVSYVNQSQLPALYKPSNAEKVDYISSIRLPSETIVESKTYSKDKNIKLVSVGSLVPIKNQVDMLKVVKKLVDLNYTVELKIIGEGVMRKELQNMIEEYSIHDNIVLVGHVIESVKILEHLDAADIFLFTSLSEGLPRSVIEAMSRGLPVISSKAGGIPELIQKSMLCKHHQIDDYVEKIIKIKFDKNLYDSTSQENLQLVRNYAQNVLSGKRVSLYNLLK